MAATDPDHSSASGIAEAVNEISERASLLVREEIELAKAEIGAKVSKLVKGAAIGGAAAVFALFGLVLLLEGFAWLAWYGLPVNESAFFWGFFLVAGILFILGGLAGFLAAKLVKSGAPPMPEMAIAEARTTKEQLSSDG